MNDFSLETLQKWMHETLIAPDVVSPEDVMGELKPNKRLSAHERLAIYQNSYKSRITACMRDQFPALCYALKAPLFDAFVADYIRVCPPQSYTLYDLGRRFAGFLNDTRPDKNEAEQEQWINFMVDLARFERTIFTRFDCEAATVKSLATKSTPDSRLVAQQSLMIEHYNFDVAGYYYAVQSDDAPDPPDFQLTSLAVFRRDDATYTLPLTSAHGRMLEAMCNGADVDEALAHVAKWSGRKLTEIRTSWKNSCDLREMWIRSGVFCDRKNIN